jgi:hypothetical protein
MNTYCDYSFADLFRAAHGREPEPAELEELYAKPRSEINQTVLEWAGQAGWRTREMKGRDGEVYVAFWPPENRP